MNQIPRPLTYMVVIAIASLALLGVGTLCASLFLHVYAEPAIITALITITSLLIGSLTTVLSSPRSQQTTDTTVQTTTTTTHSQEDSNKKPTKK